jgi:hypothetical protein
MAISGQLHSSAVLPSGKSPLCTLDRLSGQQCQSRHSGKCRQVIQAKFKCCDSSKFPEMSLAIIICKSVWLQTECPETLGLQHYCIVVVTSESNQCLRRFHAQIINIFFSQGGDRNIPSNLIRELRCWILQSTMMDIKVKVKFPLYRPWRPLGLWEVEAPTFSRQSAHRWR